MQSEDIHEMKIVVIGSQVHVMNHKNQPDFERGKTVVEGIKTDRLSHLRPHSLLVF